MPPQPSASLQIAVLGCGLMGLPMARRLLAAGHNVHAWNRTRSKAESLAAEGAHDTPRQACTQADYIISMLENGKIVGEVLFGMGQDGAIHGLRPGSLVIDMASIQPREARDHAARLSERGLRHLDAPVSGGTVGAGSTVTKNTPAGVLTVARGKQTSLDARKWQRPQKPPKP